MEIKRNYLILCYLLQNVSIYVYMPICILHIGRESTQKKIRTQTVRESEKRE